MAVENRADRRGGRLRTECHRQHVVLSFNDISVCVDVLLSFHYSPQLFSHRMKAVSTVRESVL